jgi:hypothetical protein
LSARFGTLKETLKNNIKDMLIGCILGDAHIGKVGNDKGFITFEQTIKHEDYVLDLYNKLKDSGIGLHKIKYYSYLM